VPVSEPATAARLLRPANQGLRRGAQLKVDAEGNILGFSVLKVSALKERPLEVTL
jgi:hypothetical protein